jgi:hypothetical protein
MTRHPCLYPDNVFVFPAAARALVQDRAAIVATAVLQVTRLALLAWLDHGDASLLATARSEIETLLRCEFSDVPRTTLNEIRREDG